MGMGVPAARESARRGGAGSGRARTNLYRGPFLGPSREEYWRPGCCIACDGAERVDVADKLTTTILSRGTRGMDERERRRALMWRVRQERSRNSRPAGTSAAYCTRNCSGGLATVFKGSSFWWRQGVCQGSIPPASGMAWSCESHGERRRHGHPQAKQAGHDRALDPSATGRRLADDANRRARRTRFANVWPMSLLKDGEFRLATVRATPS